MHVKKIKIFTDGSCLGNPGPGGWAAILFEGEAKRPHAVLKGGEAETTNNRMEMIAVIEALRFIHENHLQQCLVTLFSDSTLVVKTLTLGWKRKKNKDLWEELDELNEELSVDYVWVEGHAKNKWNNRCDMIAVAEAEKVKKKNHAGAVRKSFKSRQEKLF